MSGPGSHGSGSHGNGSHGNGSAAGFASASTAAATSTASDHQLGQRLARLIDQLGDQAFDSGVVSRRVLAQLQDLLGSDTALASPMRDLMLRPGFQQLFSPMGDVRRQGCKDALLQELGQIYSPAMTGRLASVLHGCLNLPPPAAAAGGSPQPQQAPSSADRTAPSSPAGPVSTEASTPAVVTIHSSANPLTGALIAVLSLLAGALLMGVVAILVVSRQPGAAPVATPARPDKQAQVPESPEPIAANPEPSAPEPSQEEVAPESWPGCQQVTPEIGREPQPGETWWPVVGPSEALEATRQHCRGDAFTNGNGNVQVASFADKDSAERFADALTRDNSHPYSFWVGDPTTR